MNVKVRLIVILIGIATLLSTTACAAVMAWSG